MTDRKDKIKNITIIFLLVMLILTFFSNTIMNYSLVEVSTQQVTSGQITSKVRGSGSVEASESYSVTIEETRKIATVNVKKDAEVATGDLLFTLEDTDSDELDAAKKSLFGVLRQFRDTDSGNPKRVFQGRRRIRGL